MSTPLISRAVSYAGLIIKLTATAELMDRVRVDLQPFFRLIDSDTDAEAVADLTMWPNTATSIQDWDRLPQTVIDVDTSLYPHLASRGIRYEGVGGHAVRIEATGSFFIFKSSVLKIEGFQSDPVLALRDCVRLIKGLFTQAIERAGGLQLHSSSVVVDGEAVLIIGDMWQGKTTLLLELMSSFEVAQMSCDTTVLRIDEFGRVRAYGWPSPFSVSHGTLADHPSLYGFFPEERRTVQYSELWAQGKKTVLTSEQVVRAMGSSIVPTAEGIRLCLVSRFRPAGTIGVQPIDSVEEFRQYLRAMYLGSRDPIYHNWHGFIEVDDAAIEENVARVADLLAASCDIRCMTWAPSAESMLSTLPALAPFHRHLGPLLYRSR